MLEAVITAFSWRHANQWEISLVPNVLLIGFAVIYVTASRRTSWPISRTLSAVAALVVTFLAVESFIGVYDHTYFSDHMIQHLMLIMIAGPLFAIAAPLELLARTAGPRTLRVIDSRVVRALTHPLVVFAMYAVFIPITHLTSFYNTMLLHEPIHDFEHVAFLLIGYLFFRVAFGFERGVQIHPGLRLVFVMAAVPVDTFTGLALAMTRRNPFPAYLHLAPAGSTAQSILNNIHLGGAIMWIGGDILMLLACIPIAVIWLNFEMQRTRELDAQLDALGI